VVYLSFFILKGKILKYLSYRGYGFIETEENGEIFVHRSGIKQFGHFGFQRDDPVTFELKETARGKQAVKVKRI